MPIGTSDGQHFEDEFHQAVEQQRRWGMPGAMSQLGDIASKLGSLPGMAAESFGKKVATAMTSSDPEEQVKSTTDLALTTAGGGVMGAERGALGIFGGRYTPFAKDFAELLETKGHDPTTIKNWSGLERGAEGMWRKEISDVASKSDFSKVQDATWNHSGLPFKMGMLDDVLQHDKFFKA